MCGSNTANKVFFGFADLASERLIMFCEVAFTARILGYFIVPKLILKKFKKTVA